MLTKASCRGGKLIAPSGSAYAMLSRECVWKWRRWCKSRSGEVIVEREWKVGRAAIQERKLSFSGKPKAESASELAPFFAPHSW